MKKIHLYITAIFITGLLAVSCKKNFLDVTPPDALSTTIFWKTEADADLALAGLYNYLYASSGGYATSQYQVVAWDNFSDDAYGQYNYGGGTNALTAGITPQSGDFVLAYYTNNYQAIAGINSFPASDFTT